MNQQNKETIHQILQENKKLKQQVKRLEKERNSAQALLELKKKFDQLMEESSLEEDTAPVPPCAKKSSP